MIKQDQSVAESFELEEVAQFYCEMPWLCWGIGEQQFRTWALAFELHIFIYCYVFAVKDQVAYNKVYISTVSEFHDC